MQITYLGTTVLLFDDGSDQLLLDAHFSRPSLLKVLFGKLQTDTALTDRLIEDYDIHRLRAVFVSHTHYDHVLDAPYIAVKTGADYFGSRSSLNAARGGGVSEEKLHEYSGSMEYSVGDFSVRVIPSRHSRPHWYNNDLGQEITHPLQQPARKRDYKEGGSFDFLVRHSGRSYLVRPSCSYIEGQLAGIQADILYLGIGGLSKENLDFRERFFAETLGRTRPQLVIPLHWDNFFTPLVAPRDPCAGIPDNTAASMRILAQYCRQYGTACLVQLPMSTLTL